MDNEVIPQVNISSEHGLRKIDFIDNDFAIFNDAWDIPMDEYPNRINAAVIAGIQTDCRQFIDDPS